MARQRSLSDSAMASLTKSLVLARSADNDEALNTPSPFTAGAPDGASMLSRYSNILKGSWIPIAIVSVICAGITVLICWNLSPVFESVATISIDVQAAPGIIGQESQRPLSVTDSDQILSTQVNMVQSDAVLRAVDEKLHFTPAELGFRKFEKNGRDVREATLALKRLTVKRVPSTYLIKVAFRSNSPKRASEVANAIASAYLARNFTERLQSSSNLSSFMDKQLAEMKVKMDSSSSALAKFEKDLDIVNPEQKTNIVSARLLQLNESYTEAQAQRISKEAAYNSAKIGTLAAVETFPQADLLRRLEEKRNALQSNFAVTAQTFGKKHPNYRSAQAELDQVDAQINTARSSIIERARLEFRQSLSNEESLWSAVAGSKKEFDRINSRSFAYQQLRRDAENDRKLYEDVQRRIREAGLNSAFQNSSIRLSDVARPAVLPVFPNTGLLGSAAFVVSALLACLAAILFHSIKRTVYRTVEIVQSLGVPVIGTLPRVKLSRAEISNQQRWGTGILNTSAPIASFISSRRTPAGTSFSESIRSIHNTIVSGNTDNSPLCVLITSALASEGKSTTALALALSHSSRHKRTLLIDADIRRPSLSANNGGDPGLADFLVDDEPWWPLIHAQPVTPSLDLLPAGQNSLRACDHLHRIEDLIQQAKAEYDLIVIDSSPVLCFADSAQIASLVDSVVLVSRAPDTNLSTLERALDNLYIAGAKLAGVVMNEVDDPDLQVGYTKYSRNYIQPATA